LTVSYNSSSLKCPTLPFGRSCSLRDGQGFLLYYYLRRFTRELPRATAQSTNTKHFKILSNAASFHTGSADAIFQLNATNPMSKNTQCVAVVYPLFYMILRE